MKPFIERGKPCNSVLTEKSLQEDNEKCEDGVTVPETLSSVEDLVGIHMLFECLAREIH